MSTELDLDIAALVGEMEAPPCESIGHQTAYLYHDSGAATHYGRVHCASCGLNVIKAYCQKFVTTVALNLLAECECGATHYASDLVTILGPVKA